MSDTSTLPTVSTAEAAKLTKYSQATIRRWVATGKLRAYRAFPGSPLRVLAADVRDMASRLGLGVRS